MCRGASTRPSCCTTRAPRYPGLTGRDLGLDFRQPIAQKDEVIAGMCQNSEFSRAKWCWRGPKCRFPLGFELLLALTPNKWQVRDSVCSEF